MLQFVNMCSEVILGNVLLKHVAYVEINEHIRNIANTAKIIIPKNQTLKNTDTPIWKQIHIGDKVQISLGYDGKLQTEFVGYIREIEYTAPLVIHCDDETYLLRKSNYVKSYKNASLKQILTDVIPSNQLKFDCPDVQVGKYNIDNASGWVVLQKLMETYSFYKRIHNGTLMIGLLNSVSLSLKPHTCYLNRKPETNSFFVKKSELGYKRKEDYKLKVRVSCQLSNGKRRMVEVGAKEDCSLLDITLPGDVSEKELKEHAQGIYDRRCSDGYTGSITGFGVPITHAGDSLTIKDNEAPERDGTYLIEQVEIIYNENEGFSRKNELTFKL